jgi:hypothetical protein
VSNSTVTVQNVVTYAQQHTRLMPLTGVGGVANEPALSIANDTMNALFTEPFPWKFNRAEMPILVTAPNKQDYKFAGSMAFTLNGGGVGIDLLSNSAVTQSSTTITVKLLESCLNIFNVGDTVYLTNLTTTGLNAVFTAGQGNATQSSWSNGFVIVSIAANGLSFTFTYAPAISTDGAPGITDWAWLESATMIQTASVAVVPNVWYLQAVRTLEPASTVAISDRVSVVTDYGTGVLKIRFRYLPGSQPMTASLIYQKKPPLLTSLSNTWSPFPDNLITAIRQMFLAMAYDYAESPKADAMFQKAMAFAMKASGADDREDAEENITPDESLAGIQGWGGWAF